MHCNQHWSLTCLIQCRYKEFKRFRIELAATCCQRFKIQLDTTVAPSCVDAVEFLLLMFSQHFQNRRQEWHQI